jgi:hypothetical protein
MSLRTRLVRVFSFLKERNPMADETQGGQTQTNPSDQNADPTQPADPKDDGGKATADAKAATDKAVAEALAKAESERPKPPEKYEFKPPEGVEFDSAMLDEYAPVFKEAGLTQEAAQKLLTSHLSLQQAAHTKQLEAWEGELKADKDFGGKNFEGNLQAAQSAVARFLAPEDKAFLDRTGLGSFPGLVKAFLRIGKAIPEDVVPPQGKGPATKGAKDLYTHPTSAALT